MLMIEDLDLGLNRPSTIIFIIVEKVLVVLGYVYVGLRPATIPPITLVTMVYCCVYFLLLVVFTKVFMEKREVMVVLMMEYMDLGIKILATIPFKIS